MGGSWSGQHTADLLRGPVLHTYGGAFIDVSIILLRTLDDYFWRELEDPNSPYEVFTPLCFDALVANNMVASRKGNIFMKAWHELFAHLWEDRTNADDIRLHPLVDPFQKALELPNVAKKGYTWDWRADVSAVMDYATQSLSWYRLAMVDGGGKETNWAQYAQDHVLYSDAWYEHYAANAELGFYGQQILDCLTTPLNADPESWEYKRAYKLIWKLLTSTSMIKGTTYTNLLATPELGALLNRPENQDKDIRPGTFGALLRYGSVHFEQTRKDMVRMKYTPLAVFNKALLEIFEV
ncbi:hypothetical protein H072_7223 [Dactylellina haptotyla CBS 200.50]|uniref:Uncharacterized protein n=1 Tax=Dactylellina haptotyla (strain CBS 200.50) TaxID=1284197 RepID=S8BUM1_DACHA|nr:hypothetical protein H072_7223 [Dactylellina haptotyla CBS 200.50]